MSSINVHNCSDVCIESNALQVRSTLHSNSFDNTSVRLLIEYCSLLKNSICNASLTYANHSMNRVAHNLARSFAPWGYHGIRGHTPPFIVPFC